MLRTLFVFKLAASIFGPRTGSNLLGRHGPGRWLRRGPALHHPRRAGVADAPGGNGPLYEFAAEREVAEFFGVLGVPTGSEGETGLTVRPVLQRSGRKTRPDVSPLRRGPLSPDHRFLAEPLYFVLDGQI
jgi:hypothetical protein